MAGQKEVQLVLTFRDDGSYQLKKVVGDINSILGQAKTGAENAGKGFEKLNTQVRQADSGFEKLKGSFKSSMLQVAAGLGIWTGLSQAISFVTHTIRDTVEQGKAFEEAFSRIRVVSKGTAEDNEAIRQTLLRMNPALGNVTENARAFSVIMREFKEYSRADQFKFLETAAKTAVAGFTTTSQAAEALTAVVKGYHMQLSKAAGIGEVLVKATQIEGVEFGELAHGLTKLSMTAHLAGVSFSELIGTYLTLAERQDPQLAMMQLRMLLTSLLKPSALVQSQAKQLGIDFSLAGVKTMGFVNWLAKLNQVTAGMPEILDNLIPGGRMMGGMLELIGDNAKEAKAKVKDLEEAFNTGGAIQKAFNERLHSTAFLLDTGKELFNRFKVSVFEGFSAPLLAGVKTQEEFDKKIKELTNRVVDFGTKVGHAIYDVITWLLKLIPNIKMTGEVMGAVFVTTKLTSWTGALINGINQSSNALAGTKLAAMGVLGVLRSIVTALGAVAVGFAAGTWLREVTHQSEEIEKLWRAKATAQGKFAGVSSVDLSELGAMMKLKDLAKDSDTNIVKLMLTLGGWRSALKAVETGQVTLIPHVKTAAELTKDSATYQKALKAALEGTSTATEESDKNLTGLTDTEKKHIIALNRAREEMKKYGFTFKTELVERYNALKLGLETFKKDMTVEDYEKLRAELKKLGADLGYFSKGLSDLGILTKFETSVEIAKVTKRFDDLKKASDSGAITWENYHKGIDKVNSDLKNLDPTLTATINGIQKLSETKLPASRVFAGGLPTTPIEAGIPSPMLSAQEMQAALASVGPSFLLLKQWETDLGVPLRDIAQTELPNLTTAFQYAMGHNLIATTNVGTAAENLIKHYKDAGEKIPKWLQNIADAAAKSAKTSTNTMVMAFSTLSGALSSLADNVAERYQALLKTASTVSASIADSITKSGTFDLSKIFEGTAGAQLAGQLGAGISEAITGHKSKFSGVGTALGAVLGSIIPGVGTALGAAIGGLIGGLFGGKSAEQKAAEALDRQVKALQKTYLVFGKITDETAKKIIEMTKAFNYQTSQILTLGDVMNDVGIDSKNLSEYLKKMRQALADMASGSVNASKGLDAVASAFNSLVTWAQKFGQEGNKQLVGFIQLLRKVGVSIKEVDDYVFSQLAGGVAGLKKMTDSFGGASYDHLVAYKDQIATLTTDVQNLEKSKLSTREEQLDFQRKKSQLAELIQNYDVLKNTVADEVAPELERITNLTLATFNSLISQGMSMTDAFTAMSDPLTSLKDKYETLGIAGGEAIQELFKIMDVSAANKDLMSALDGNKMVLEALGNTGFLTASSLKDVATQAESYYEKLTKSGLTSKEALAMMSPTLSDLDYYAKQYGITLDDNTKSLIEQAKVAGVFKEKGKDLITTLKEGFGAVADRLDILINRLGRDLPKSVDDAITQIDRAQTSAERRAKNAASGDYYTEGAVEKGYYAAASAGSVSGGTGISTTQQTSVKVPTPMITIKPVVIPMNDMKQVVIEFVQEASDNETLLIRPKSVRGRG